MFPAGCTALHIVTEMWKIASNGLEETRNRLKALEMLAKARGLFVIRHEDVNVTKALEDMREAEQAVESRGGLRILRRDDDEAESAAAVMARIRDDHDPRREARPPNRLEEARERGQGAG